MSQAPNKSRLIPSFIGLSLVLSMALGCVNPTAVKAAPPTGSAATQDTFGNNLPSTGLLTLGKFKKNQKKNNQGLNTPLPGNATTATGSSGYTNGATANGSNYGTANGTNTTSTGATSPQTNPQTYNNSGNWTPTDILSPLQQMINRGAVPPATGNLTNPTTSANANTATSSASSSGGRSDNNFRLQTGMGDFRLKYLQSAEGAENRLGTQPDMMNYTGTDIRTTEGKYQGVAVPTTYNGGESTSGTMYSVPYGIPTSKYNAFMKASTAHSLWGKAGQPIFFGVPSTDYSDLANGPGRERDPEAPTLTRSAPVLVQQPTVNNKLKPAVRHGRHGAQPSCQRHHVRGKLHV